MAAHYTKGDSADIHKKYAANSFRAEARWLQRDVVKSATGLSTVSELLSDFENVQHAYRKQFKKRLFNLNATALGNLNRGSMSVDDFVAELRKMRSEKPPRYWFQNWMDQDWLKHQTPERLDAIEAAAKQFMSEEGITNPVKKLSAMRKDRLKLAPSTNSKRSMADLYSELRDKILAD